MAQEKIEFPIMGKVMTVNVKPGDIVTEDDVICVLESMKMENPIMATCKGKVIEVNVTPGQVVNEGDIAAVIEC